MTLAKNIKRHIYDNYRKQKEIHFFIVWYKLHCACPYICDCYESEKNIKIELSVRQTAKVKAKLGVSRVTEYTNGHYKMSFKPCASSE